jgi:alanyl-tRNA synthetase
MVTGDNREVCPLKTERLYWEDPLGRDFEARILEITGSEGRIGVFLDRTLFHPEGGGQPADRGFLTLLSDEAVVAFGRNDLKVEEVIEEGERILHLISGEVSAERLPYGLPKAPEGGWPVRGKIDWDHRFDLMQQHTGQHILSRAFEELLDARTVGFHLGKDYVSVDLDIPALSEEERDRVEDRANRVVFDDLPVTGREYPKDQLPGGIRARFSIDAENIRVVSVGGYDSCPCGGTHVVSSGQVGLIKVNQVDRAHGGVRVLFRCGNRALSDYREKERLLSQAAGVLSMPLGDLPSAVQSTLARLRDLEKELEEACQMVLDSQIERRLRAFSESGEPVVVEAFESLRPDRLKYAARKLSEASGKLTVCFSRAPRFSVVVMSPSGSHDARAVVSLIASRWGGRGGGTAGYAQLGSKEPLDVPDDEVIAGVKELLAGG